MVIYEFLIGYYEIIETSFALLTDLKCKYSSRD